MPVTHLLVMVPWVLRFRILDLTDGGAPELWNVDQPAKVASVLDGYAAAGANVVTTNTFGGTKGRLEMHDLGDRVFELNKAGSEVARSVADKYENVFVLETSVHLVN
jgi:5-methyltetrahydrofolate--homocysteine methyltransferase